LRKAVGAAGVADADQNALSSAVPGAAVDDAVELVAKQASLKTTRGKLLTLYELSSAVLFPGDDFRFGTFSWNFFDQQLTHPTTTMCSD
jgi:hypothetical protein